MSLSLRSILKTDFVPPCRLLTPKLAPVEPDLDAPVMVAAQQPGPLIFTSVISSASGSCRRLHETRRSTPPADVTAVAASGVSVPATS
jgi:hypothetical protein